MLNIQPRPAQVVVDLTTDHVERANLWIPEIVEIGTSGEFLPFAKNPKYPVAWIKEDDTSSYILEIPGLLSLAASVRADESGFTLEMAIGNSAAEDWNQVHACTCLQLTPAAAFLDLGWERTWCVVDGQLVRVAEMKKVGKGKPYYLFSMLDGHEAPLRHRDPHRADAKWVFLRKRARIMGLFVLPPSTPPKRCGPVGRMSSTCSATQPPHTVASTRILISAISGKGNGSRAAVAWAR